MAPDNRPILRSFYSIITCNQEPQAKGPECSVHKPIRDNITFVSSIFSDEISTMSTIKCQNSQYELKHSSSNSSKIKWFVLLILYWLICLHYYFSLAIFEKHLNQSWYRYLKEKELRSPKTFWNIQHNHASHQFNWVGWPYLLNLLKTFMATPASKTQHMLISSEGKSFELWKNNFWVIKHPSGKRGRQRKRHRWRETFTSIRNEREHIGWH